MKIIFKNVLGQFLGVFLWISFLVCCHTFVYAQDKPQPVDPSQQPSQSSEEPSPLYIQLMTQWAKSTNFAQNAAKVIVGKLMFDMQKDPKLQKIVSPQLNADLEQFFYELFLSQYTIKEFAKLYSQYFSIDEMQDLLKFYESPIGQKLIKVDPELKIKTQQIGAELLKNHQKEYMQVVAKYLVPEQDKKY